MASDSSPSRIGRILTNILTLSFCSGDSRLDGDDRESLLRVVWEGWLFIREDGFRLYMSAKAWDRGFDPCPLVIHIIFS